MSLTVQDINEAFVAACKRMHHGIKGYLEAKSVLALLLGGPPRWACLILAGFMVGQIAGRLLDQEWRLAQMSCLALYFLTLRLKAIGTK